MTESKTLRKGDVLTLKIASLAPGGEGVSRDFGMPVFVNRVAPGDVAEVRLFDVRKDFARGEVVSLVEPSAVRTEPPCKIFKVCGGCQWQHIDYAAQLESKADILRQAIKHIGHLPPDLVLNTIGAVDPLFYRNKVQFPVETVSGTGRILAGYFKEGSHELVNIKHCPVQPEPLDRVLEIAKEAVQDSNLTTYDEKTGRGMLRHIAMRYSFAYNRVLVTLVINAENASGPGLHQRLKGIAQVIMDRVSEVAGVLVNFNPARGNRIMGGGGEILLGESNITEVLRSNLPDAPPALRKGIQYQLSSLSFFQVNSKQASVLLDEVLLAVLGVEKGTHGPLGELPRIPLVIDAYAGVGTMALWLSSIAERVIAIEEFASAVRDGEMNRDLNGMTNVEFVEAKVEDDAPRMVNDGLRPNVILVDPPRKGLHPRGLSSLIELAPERIVYVSCNPSTLARDLRILEDNGYKTKRIQPVDMFPQTYHVESVTVLEKAGS
jgi:23S rRNA (uracil1939-C5)-methyltransferase